MLAKSLWNKWVAGRCPPGKEVRLDYNRIFILPSRQGIGFLVVLILILLIGINYQNNLAYALCFLMGSVFIVAILHTWRNLAGLILLDAGASPVFWGEQVHFKVRLESAGRSRQAVALSWEGDSEGLVVLTDISQDHEADILLTKTADRRGWFFPGRMRVETVFPLGLLITWTYVDLSQIVLVYPKPVPGVRPAGYGAEGDTEDGVKVSGQGPDDFQGLRVYQPGDSKRLLNWKVFSKEQGLFVKDFAALTGSNIWLDFQAMGGNTEGRLSQLCYWVLKLSDEGRPFNLRLPGSDLLLAHDKDRREIALRALALYGDKP